MTDKQRKPDPIEYDESIVQRLPYVPASHDEPDNLYRWSGGFFGEGRRNPYPAGSDGDPLLVTLGQYEGLGPMAAAAALADDSVAPVGTRRCAGCHRAMPLGMFSPKPGSQHGRLRSRCDVCVAYDRGDREARRRWAAGEWVD